MNRINFHPSCQFVHQNASTNIQCEVGRDKFTQKLNKFTVNAAKEEHCEGQYKTFSQVIKFDDQTDVHYFPALWKGDPPMAPVNQGYSHAAQTLKKYIIDIMNRRVSTSEMRSSSVPCGLNIGSLSRKISDFWSTLLKENFVFSFKNTLEIAAYCSLEREYNCWDWTFQVAISDWERKTSNLINPIEDVHKAMILANKKMKELPEYVSKQYKILQNEMDIFFNGDNSETLAQWRANFQLKLQQLSVELKNQAETQCQVFLQKKQSISAFAQQTKITVEKIKLKVQENIQYLKDEQISLQASLEKNDLDTKQLSKLLSRDLFNPEKVERYKVFGIDGSLVEKIISIKQKSGGNLSEEDLKYILLKLLTVDQVGIVLKYSTPHEDELKRMFNELWEDVIKQFPETLPTRNLDVPEEVERSITKHIGKHDGVLISLMRTEKFKNWKEGKIPLFKPEEEHFNTTWAERGMRAVTTMFRKDHYYMKIYHVTSSVLQEANSHVGKYTTVETDFNPKLVSELLREVDTFFEYHTSKITDYTISFTSEYTYELYIRACSSAIPIFQKIAKKFEDANNPRLHLEKYEKTPLFTLYKNQYQQTEAEEAIGDTICAYLEEPLKAQVNGVLCTAIIDKVKKSDVYYLTDKMALKVKVLIDLHKKSDFQDYMVYVRDIRECLSVCTTNYITIFADKKVHCSKFSKLQMLAHEKVNNLVEIVRNNVPTNTKPNLKEWLAEFSKLIISHFGISIKVDDHFKGYNHLQELNLENLKKKLMKQIDDLEMKVSQSFNQILFQDVIEHNKEPLEKHLKVLLGCTSQCPFCGEQCDLNEHSIQDQLHRTEVHRVGCLGGCKNKRTKILDTNFCPEQVASNSWVFYIEGNEIHYRDYQTIYKEWSITPNITSRSTKYWKWFAMNYRKELAEEFHAKPAKMIPSWLYEWEEIVKDLQEVYHVGILD